ncbi:MAG: hypothetical protein AB1589_40425 [Cyanobacteriota bacterium]
MSRNQRKGRLVFRDKTTQTKTTRGINMAARVADSLRVNRADVHTVGALL